MEVGRGLTSGATTVKVFCEQTGAKAVKHLGSPWPDGDTGAQAQRKVDTDYLTLDFSVAGSFPSGNNP